MESLDSPRPNSVLGETPRAAGLPTLTTASLAVESMDSLRPKSVLGETPRSEGLSTLTTAWILWAPYAD